MVIYRPPPTELIKPEPWDANPLEVVDEHASIWDGLKWATPIAGFPPQDVLGSAITVNGGLGTRDIPMGLALDFDGDSSKYLSCNVGRFPTGPMTVMALHQMDDFTNFDSLVGTTGDDNNNGIRLVRMEGPVGVRFRTVQAGTGVNEDLATPDLAIGDIALCVGTYDGTTSTAYYRNLTTGVALDGSGSAESGTFSHVLFDVGRVTTTTFTKGGMLFVGVWDYAWPSERITAFADDPFGWYRRKPRVRMGIG